MANSVLNLSRNCHIKHNQALSRIEALLAEWVIPGQSMRELTLCEVMEKRAHQARVEHDLRTWSGSNEIPGVKWEPPVRDRAKMRERWTLLREARQFYEAAIS